MGFAMTRRQARQLVSHAHFTVNGKKVNIPSYLVKAGDVIEVAESSRSSEVFKRLMGQDAPVFLVPTWMERDKNSLKGTVVRLPAREEIDVPVEEHLIVELYLEIGGEPFSNRYRRILVWPLRPQNGNGG